jgi:hypothetical protein
MKEILIKILKNVFSIVSSLLGGNGNYNQKNKTIYKNSKDNFNQSISGTNVYNNNYFCKENNEWDPDLMAKTLLKKIIEGKENTILYIRNIGCESLQCNSGNFSVNTVSVGQNEMSRWIASFNNLIKYEYIYDAGTKGQVYKVSSKGYDYYDKNK